MSFVPTYKAGDILEITANRYGLRPNQKAVVMSDSYLDALGIEEVDVEFPSPLRVKTACCVSFIKSFTNQS